MDNKQKYKDFLMPYLNPVYIEGYSHEYGAFEIKKSLYSV